MCTIVTIRAHGSPDVLKVKGELAGRWIICMVLFFFSVMFCHVSCRFLLRI